MLLVLLVVAPLSVSSTASDTKGDSNSTPGAAYAAGSEVALFYGGLEFYGSSLVTRAELERMAGIKVGASMKQVTAASERITRNLTARHVSSNVQVVASPPDKVFLVVDITSPASQQIPCRALKLPHRVNLPTEKPQLLLEKLRERLDRLSSEGRMYQEETKDGIRFYSDEPANQIVQEIRRYAPQMLKDLIEVVDNDPEPKRRFDAIELLNWAGSVPQVTYHLIGALDDSDPDVRANVIRYMYPRFALLPGNFPIGQLAESVCRQVYRPSHQDRSKSLHCLVALLKVCPPLTPPVKKACESKVAELASTSQLPTVKIPAQELLELFKKPLPPPPVRSEPVGTFAPDF